MRLNEAGQIGVQSLGREDLSGPARAWQAKANADNALNKAVYDAGAALGELFDGQDEAANLLSLQERVLKDRTSQSATLGYLENTTQIDTADEDVPKEIRDFTKKWAKNNSKNGVTLTTVPTHEIIDGYMASMYKKSKDDSLAVLKGTGLEHKYVGAMIPSMTAGAGRTMSTKAIKRQQGLDAQGTRHFEAAIDARDEGTAMQIAEMNKASGAWDEAKYEESIAKLGPTIDYMNVSESINDATSQGALDMAEDQLDASRVTPDKRMALMGKLRQQQTYMHTLSGRRQGVNYGTGVDLLIKGELTNEWIGDQVRSQGLSGSQANALRVANNKPSPNGSSSRSMTRVDNAIIGIRYPAEGQTATEAAKVANDVVRMFATGITTDGTSVDRTLTGADVKRYGEEIDKALNTALGKGGQKYATAKSQLKAMTGYSDSIAKMIEGPYPAGQAYSAFSAALQTYMDAAGTDADPVDWVAKNSARFTADVYAKGVVDRLASQYPQYQKHLSNGIIDTGAILRDATKDRADNILSLEDYTNIRRSVEYTLVTEQRRPTASSGDLM